MLSFLQRTLFQRSLLTRADVFRKLTYTGMAGIKARGSEVPTHRNEFLPFTINNLWDNPGAKRIAKRVGRGGGNGKGKTAGRGHGGHRSRTGGGMPPRFEGGQTPLQKRLPKWGIPKVNREFLDYINLSTLNYFLERGRLDSSKVITIKDMIGAGVFPRVKYGVKILGKGAQYFSRPINIEVSDASKSAIEAIKKAGGSVTCVYRTRLKLREHLFPEKFPLPLADPLPVPKTVAKLEAIRERGAKVVFNEPEWFKKEKAEEEKEKSQDKKAEEEFVYPAVRTPGVGANRIRKRRTKLVKRYTFQMKQ